jgi:hypothetical protein
VGGPHRTIPEERPRRTRQLISRNRGVGALYVVAEVVRCRRPVTNASP